MVLEVAFLRGRQGSVSLDTLEKVSLELPIAAVLGLLLVIVFWHYAIYEPAILRLKDLVTRVLRIDNYRHWMKRKYSIHGLNPEELYGYLWGILGTHPIFLECKVCKVYQVEYTGERSKQPIIGNIGDTSHIS
jgi:hypothetical protein